MKFLTLSVFLRLAVFSAAIATNNKIISKVTISVCTGPDCRVDGSIDCLRRLQKDVGSSENYKEKIAVKSRSCLGPCGDGPLVTVRDEKGQKIAIPKKDQPPWQRGSLVPYSGITGSYQVRTNEQADFILNLAIKTAGLNDNQDADADAVFDEIGTKGNQVFVSSKRKWYDRPRNERVGLQRLAQGLIMIGLVQHNESHGAIGNTQWSIACFLLFCTNFIMKENLVQMAVKKWFK